MRAGRRLSRRTFAVAEERPRVHAGTALARPSGRVRVAVARVLLARRALAAGPRSSLRAAKTAAGYGYRAAREGLPG